MDNSSLVAGRYRQGKKLGKGSFGELYAATDLETNHEVALKLEPIRNKHQTLVQEARVLRDLQGILGVPVVHWAGVSADFNVIVLELLGASLEDLLTVCGRKIGLKSSIQLGEQMIRRVESVHEGHYLHRDVKPENFLMGLGKRTETLYIIDFGLSKRYRDQKTHQHIPYKEGRSLTGTARYASINAHAGIEQGRRDDLESVLYVLIYLMRGNLPWQGIVTKTKNEKYHKIMEVKMAVPLDRLCTGCPRDLEQMITYVRGLKFDEKPDYDRLVRGLKHVAARCSLILDRTFQWETPNRRRSHSDMASVGLTQKRRNSKRKREETLLRSKTTEKKVPIPAPSEDMTPRGKQCWPRLSAKARVSIDEIRGTQVPSTSSNSCTIA